MCGHLIEITNVYLYYWITYDIDVLVLSETWFAKGACVETGNRRLQLMATMYSGQTKKAE